MAENKLPGDSITVAKTLASKLNALGQDYALGGAIALGFWSTPRGTMDVDLTLFVKMMFFREKDLVDLKQILRIQHAQFDRTWVRPPKPLRFNVTPGMYWPFENTRPDGVGQSSHTQP